MNKKDDVILNMLENIEKLEHDGFDKTIELQVYLPSLFDQFKNKMNKKENKTTYRITIELKEKEDE